MSKRKPLRTHLLAEYSSSRLKTACGMSAVPQNWGTQAFAPPSSTSIYEGTVPGSVGVGIVVAPVLSFEPDRAPGGLCVTCQSKYG